MSSVTASYSDVQTLPYPGTHLSSNHAYQRPIRNTWSRGNHGVYSSPQEQAPRVESSSRSTSVQVSPRSQEPGAVEAGHLPSPAMTTSYPVARHVDSPPHDFEYRSHTASVSSRPKAHLTSRPDHVRFASIDHRSMSSKGAEDGRRVRQSEVLPNSQIPSIIDRNRGSLADLAARVTCLFWFERTTIIQTAETCVSSGISPPPLHKDATPTSSFSKWVTNILSTTHVTPCVVLLALLFVYRLKTLNPTVKGAVGSEYRLLTVALMLSNKFLDDNTYTNKTWSDVSGIAVKEIHVMEVEFLGNMRYGLLTTAAEWQSWYIKMANFQKYIEAARTPWLSPQQTFYSAHGSPTTVQGSPYPVESYQPELPPYTSQHTIPLPAYGGLPPVPDLHPTSLTARKRSYDEEIDEPPSKRPQPDSLSYSGSIRKHHPRAVSRLPSLVTTPHSMSSCPGSAYSQNVLPPLNGSAMSHVYGIGSSFTPTSMGITTPTMQLQPSSQHYHTPSGQRISPRSVTELMALHSSPISTQYARRAHDSPSIYLQQRSSPYKPVLAPYTLLNPPPSTAMHSHIADHGPMQYNPLGRRSDYRLGVVPDYRPTYYSSDH